MMDQSDSFDALADTYNLDTEETTYNGRDVIEVQVRDCHIGCSANSSRFGNHKVVYMEGEDELKPRHGEFGDMYAQTVLKEMSSFTNVDRYLRDEGIEIEGVTTSFYTTVREAVGTFFKS